jgi:hypothetical protein
MVHLARACGRTSGYMHAGTFEFSARHPQSWITPLSVGPCNYEKASVCNWSSRETWPLRPDGFNFYCSARNDLVQFRGQIGGPPGNIDFSRRTDVAALYMRVSDTARTEAAVYGRVILASAVI